MANTNLIISPNMDSLTGWSLFPTDTGYSNSIASNVLTNTTASTATSVDSYALGYTSVTVTDNHKYYCRGTMQVTNALATNLILQIITEALVAQNVEYQSSPAQNTDYTISGIVEWVSGYNTYTAVLAAIQRYGSTADASGKSMKIKQWLMVDLTAEYGAGNEPNLTTCDAWDWWEGEQSSAPVLSAVQDGTHIDLSWT